MPLLPIAVKVLITFDHELFFGPSSGTPQRCLIEPGRALASVAAEAGAPLCFFVDAGYLVALRRHVKQHAVLQSHDAAVRRSLDDLARAGHELLLHVHPHWEDARWQDTGWQFDMARYALSAFSDDAVTDVVGRQAEELRLHARDGRIHAYRAGGWAVQPFGPIGRALLAADIRIDSTVFPGGRDLGGGVGYDFTAAPAKSVWRFDADPAIESDDGRFLEVATSAMTVWPTYYWRRTAMMLRGKAALRPYGDGRVRKSSAEAALRDKLTKLLRPTLYCVTLDGPKAALALPAYRRAKRRGDELLVLLSHPKMITPYSLDCLRRLLQTIRDNGDEVVGYESFVSAAFRGSESAALAADAAGIRPSVGSIRT